MGALIAAALFLPLSHFGMSSTPLRALLVRRLGEGAYRGLYSLVAAGAFIWLAMAFNRAPSDQLWVMPPGLRWLVLAVVLVAFALVVVGLTSRNPTLAGRESLLRQPDTVRGIMRITRNPFLWGVTLWALAHIAASGDSARILLFGSIGALGLIGSVLIDRKYAARQGASWASFAAATSNVPFAAIVQGRQSLGAAVAEMGWWRPALAVALYAGMLHGHRAMFGISPLTGL